MGGAVRDMNQLLVDLGLVVEASQADCEGMDQKMNHSGVTPIYVTCHSLCKVEIVEGRISEISIIFQKFHPPFEKTATL